MQTLTKRKHMEVCFNAGMHDRERMTQYNDKRHISPEKSNNFNFQAPNT